MFAMKQKLWHYLATVGYFCVVRTRSELSPCTTPNGETAFCKPLFSCPILRNAIAIRDTSVERFIEASTLACGSGTLSVCCGTLANYTASTNVGVTTKNIRQEALTSPAYKREYALNNILPSKKYCGMQHADDYPRDYNTRETTVDELPWVMFASCDAPPDASSWSSSRGYALPSKDCDCSGVLISRQYVLTASNCASARWVGLRQREQYGNASCTATPYGDDCSEAAKNPIIKQMRYPNSTLVLLRLNSKMDYSDYIRPICLPLEENDGIGVGETATSPKWEIDDKVRGYARSKLNLTITNNNECSHNLQNSLTYICTRIEDDVTFLCKHDSGAPMMYKRQQNWFVGGVLYAAPCTTKTAVFNGITPEVVNWILENMKP